MNPNPIVRRVIYHGRVQGVGFRATTRTMALHHPVQGTVRNLSNGTVELIVQGNADDVTRFLDEVSGRFSACITSCDQQPGGLPADVQGFQIR